MSKENKRKGKEGEVKEHKGKREKRRKQGKEIGNKKEWMIVEMERIESTGKTNKEEEGETGQE